MGDEGQWISRSLHAFSGCSTRLPKGRGRPLLCLTKTPPQPYPPSSPSRYPQLPNRQTADGMRSDGDICEVERRSSLNGVAVPPLEMASTLCFSPVLCDHLTNKTSILKASTTTSNCMTRIVSCHAPVLSWYGEIEIHTQ